MNKFSHMHKSVSAPVRGRSGERGVILPLVLVSVSAFVLLSALVIDGSHAYPQRRDMQNAADAASMAGTRALDNVRYEGAGWDTVLAAVNRSAVSNGAEEHDCHIVAGNGDVIGLCSQSWAVTHDAAAGVAVSATDKRPTTFGVFVGQDEVTARAESAATIQKFIGDTGVPFIVCGNAGRGGYDFLGPDGNIDPVRAAAVGRVPIQYSQVPTCGAGGAFKGKIKNDYVIPSVPGWIPAHVGNGFNADIQVQVLGASACGPDEIEMIEQGSDVNCDILLPIADEGRGNGNNGSMELHATAWGIFNVTGTGQGNPKYWGEYRASGALVANGRTSTELPAHGGVPRSIRLIK